MGYIADAHWDPTGTALTAQGERHEIVADRRVYYLQGFGECALFLLRLAADQPKLYEALLQVVHEHTEHFEGKGLLDPKAEEDLRQRSRSHLN